MSVASALVLAMAASACSPASGRADLSAPGGHDSNDSGPDDDSGDDGAGGGGEAGQGGQGGGSGGSGGGDGGSGGQGGAGGGNPPICPAGTIECQGDVKAICDGLGGHQFIDCAPQTCVPHLGCAECKPGSFDCDGSTLRVCRDDGSGWDLKESCDAELGLTCDATYGWCEGACSQDVLADSYIGCEYFPTVTANLVNPSFDFAIAVSNTSTEPAQVTVRGGALGSPIVFTVPANGLEVRTLPWVSLLKACNSEGALECGGTSQAAALAKAGAYHVKSTQPVTVYQFNPLQFAKNNKNSYSNDASLLLPKNALTGNYYVAAWQFWKSAMPGLLAVTATQDGTVVTVNPKAPVNAGNGAPAFPANQNTNVTLDKGDVLQLLNHTGDLTGSFISATKPVQVIGGHHCTQVPIGTPACDHLEESMFPVETLADHYIITAPAVPSMPNGKTQTIRIIATEPNTTLGYDPPQGGAATATIANAGQFIELRNANSFAISSDKRILVAQYMNSQDAGGNTGDPAMALAVATAQFRREYLFHAPTNYTTNYVNIVAPTGATITLDGTVLNAADFAVIGATGYGIARKQLAKLGNHRIEGDMPFGISVYGYGQYTSYWYPGGLNLERF